MLDISNLIYNITYTLNRTTFSIQEIQNILFLIDWRAALSEKPSISNLEWEIGTDGAYSKNFQDKIKSYTKLFSFEDGDRIKINPQQSPSTFIIIDWQKNIMDFTLSKIQNLNKQDFDNLVKSLFPMKLEKFAPINLSSIAKDYLSSGVPIQKIKFD
ncbi:hypothetical protein [Geothrix fuzhouensis]|uniref:hypothetical protein n=1 Tax=Geothrix fuzhouensis TaxID=2966451 RepID=UPI00214998A3|nr:hypothetical protein [Geothrix fuzhouensis]